MHNFHNSKAEDVLGSLKTSLDGLTSSQIKRRTKRHGFNKLKEQKRLGEIQILLGQFKSPLIYILLIAGLIALLLKEVVDSSVIFGAVFINTVIGFVQENKANNALRKLKKMIEHKALVIRGGEEKEIDSKDLTVGDIVVLQSGKRVPADLRIVESTNLQINEASLTGESVPVGKFNGVVPLGASLGDRKNMAYASTIISRGTGKGVVVAVGNNTEIGKIADLVRTTEEEKTPLQVRLAKLSKFIGVLVAIICTFVVIIGVLQGREFFDMFIIGVAIAVASIPEGLVVAVTVILVLGMQRILKRKSLVRKVIAAETLGSTTVICTDKTGTLTEGKMHVAHIVIGEKEFEIKDSGSRQSGDEAKYVSLALEIGMMCNSAIVENPRDELKDLKIVGAPTENALLFAAIQSGLDKKELLKREPKIAELAFDSANKFMITLHKREKNGYVIYEKGAPERLFKKSEGFIHSGKVCKLTKEKEKKLIKTYEKLTSKGLRVIGVATRNIGEEEFKKKLKPKTKEEGIKIKSEIDWKLVDKGMTFVGFIALKDPLRAEARETIDICRRAGIKPIIITGDHRLTARAVAEEVGLNTKEECVTTGEILDKTDDEKLKSLVKKIDVYARVSPHHKLRIVKALQANNEVVAMTGDGVNDSPALKASDIGIALGTGTDIAKETADIVLMDNNFKTIVAAINEGRVIFANTRKVITYLASDSFSEVILIVGSIILSAMLDSYVPLAILPVQILWINIVNDGLPNFALAFEKGDKDIMKQKPISKNEPIVNNEMKIIIFATGIIRDFFIFGIFYYLFRNNFDTAYIQTIVFASVGVDSLIYIFSLRSLTRPIWTMNPFSNMYLVFAVLASFFFLLIAIYIPFLQNTLSTIALGYKSWLMIISAGVINVIMIETVKHYFIKKK